MAFSFCLTWYTIDLVQRDRRYWLRLIRLAAVALAVGLVGGIVGCIVLTSALYAHALTHPGCVETGITPTAVGIEDAQEIAYLSHDGLTLRAWYLPPQNGAVIILLPGRRQPHLRHRPHQPPAPPAHLWGIGSGRSPSPGATGPGRGAQGPLDRPQLRPRRLSPRRAGGVGAASGDVLGRGVVV